MKLNRNIFLAALVVIVVVPVLVENVVLVRRMSKLQAMFSAAISKQEVPVLRVGDIVAPTALQNLDGKTVNLSMDAPKILFIFSSNCPFCKKNFGNWKAIEERVGKSNVLYLSVDPAEIVKPFAREHQIEGETLLLSRAQAAALKSFRIPETIQVAEGKVTGIRIGVLSPEETNHIGLMN
ncbi:MAG: TlpA family protein disulfide reductase [Candidatus Acidiferrales bacterium]